MEYAYQNGRLLLSGLTAFSLPQCLDCGQAFRWRQCGASWIGVALGCEITATQCGDTLELAGVRAGDTAAFIRYFDLERDYIALQHSYAADPLLRRGIAFADGLRVLRQPPFETLITFIISANNNVPRIKRIVAALSARFGRPLGADFDFPEADVLAYADEEALLACGAGYRARFIKGAARMIADGFDLGGVAQLPYEQARKALTALPGVGLKVADCVALYGLGFLQAFPCDVWIRRVLAEGYGFTGKSDADMRRFVSQTFGAHAGIAQQYLFHYARRHKDGVFSPAKA